MYSIRQHNMKNHTQYEVSVRRSTQCNALDKPMCSVLQVVFTSQGHAHIRHTTVHTYSNSVWHHLNVKHWKNCVNILIFIRTSTENTSLSTQILW